MIRLYKNMKRAPYNKPIDHIEEGSFHHSTSISGPQNTFYPGAIIGEGSKTHCGKAFHFNDYSILFENTHDLDYLIERLIILKGDK